MIKPREATVIRLEGRRVKIDCPYCDRGHWHTISGDGPQWFAPGCGLFLNQHQRVAGYVFSTYTRK